MESGAWCRFILQLLPEHQEGPPVFIHFFMAPGLLNILLGGHPAVPGQLWAVKQKSSPSPCLEAAQGLCAIARWPLVLCVTQRLQIGLANPQKELMF